VSDRFFRDRISEEIRRTGSIPFSRFMELALYHPEWGYYASGRAVIGSRGDFYTSVSVGSAFAGMVCEQAVQVWDELGTPSEFVFVEYGAHDGMFAADFLEWARRYHPPFSEAVRYVISEPFEPQRSRQQGTLKPEAHVVDWVSDPSELPVHQGMHFGNEVLDALPFDLFVWDGENWCSRCVGLEAGELVFRDAASPQMADLGLPPVAPFRRERRCGIPGFLQATGSRLEKGAVLFADYGHPAAAFLEEHRKEGTAVAYRRHRRSNDLLKDPGEQDLTAHVDFTEVAKAADAIGLTPVGYADQYHFVVGAGESWMRDMEGNPDARHQLRALTNLLHPETMGRAFKFLALWKGGEPSPTLAGFRHSKPVRSTLGIDPDAG